MKEYLLGRFVESVVGKKVLGIGQLGAYASRLKSVCDFKTFDISNSAMKFDSGSVFKQNELVRLPFADDEMSGVIVNRIIGYGDVSFLLKEISRVTSGRILIIEDDFASLPFGRFASVDNIMLESIAVDGVSEDPDMMFSEFFTMDLRRKFRHPGGSLDKFNILVPVDIRHETAMLCKVIK